MAKKMEINGDKSTKVINLNTVGPTDGPHNYTNSQRRDKRRDKSVS